MKNIYISIILFLIAFMFVSCQDHDQDQTFSVVFYSSGGSAVPTVFNLKKGEKLQKPEDPTKTGGDFVGWYKEIELINPWDFDNDTVEKSITLFAKWDLGEYTITYHLDGGHFPDNLPSNLYPTTYNINSPNIFLKPTSSAYFPVHPERGRFLGWWKEPNLTEEQRRDIPQTDMIPTGSSGDIDLYAYYRNK